MDGPNMGDAGHHMGEDEPTTYHHEPSMYDDQYTMYHGEPNMLRRSPRCVMTYHYFCRVKRDIVWVTTTALRLSRDILWVLRIRTWVSRIKIFRLHNRSLVGTSNTIKCGWCGNIFSESNNDTHPFTTPYGLPVLIFEGCISLSLRNSVRMSLSSTLFIVWKYICRRESLWVLY